MRMMCMQNMHRYEVQRGSVQTVSLEDSTDATTMDWAGMIWRLKGHMALPINFMVSCGKMKNFVAEGCRGGGSPPCWSVAKSFPSTVVRVGS